MDLKLLEKLVRLANNNPNEHEANLAARRACKLIEDGKFVFYSIPPTSSQSPPLTYNDIRRSTEPAWRTPGPPDWWIIFEKAERERKRTDNPYVQYEAFNERKAKERRLLKCKTCKEEVLTVFIGLPEFFECNECQWKSYGESKK